MLRDEPLELVVGRAGAFNGHHAVDPEHGLDAPANLVPRDRFGEPDDDSGRDRDLGHRQALEGGADVVHERPLEPAAVAALERHLVNGGDDEGDALHSARSLPYGRGR